VTLLEVEGLQKTYRSPTGESEAVLHVPRFELGECDQVGLAGRSGSGKSTFLHLIAGILRPDSGRVCIGGTDVTSLSESRRDRFRARNVGCVFQTFHLLQGYSALENVMLGMMFGPGPDRPEAEVLLRRLGLEHRMHHRPRQLSVGQQQRVAVARALAARPRLVLADEPTGNLDPAHAGEALALLRECCEERDAALLLVSHDPDILSGLPRVVPFAEVNRAGTESRP